MTASSAPMSGGGDPLVSVSWAVTLDDINHPSTGDLIVPVQHLIDEAQVVEISRPGIESVRIRSPLTCEIQDRHLRNLLRS
jgi:hypothetical protein